MTGGRFTAAVTTVVVAVCILLSFSGIVPAAPAEGGKHVAPQEAIDACKGFKDGDAARMKTSGGETVTGTCRTMDGILVLVPSGLGVPGEGGKRTPPQAAIDACKGRKAGDSASMKSPGGDGVQGTCREIDGQLVLVPEGMGGQRGGASGQR